MIVINLKYCTTVNSYIFIVNLGQPHNGTGSTLHTMKIGSDSFHQIIEIETVGTNHQGGF